MQVLRDSWRQAWASMVGAAGAPPTVTAAKGLQAMTLGEDVLRSMLRDTSLRPLAREAPWETEGLEEEVADAVEESQGKALSQQTAHWLRLYGPPELYRGARGSRKGWCRFYALQAQPVVLLAEGRGEAAEGHCCAGCAEVAPQGVDEGAWARAHTLLHCQAGEGLLEARNVALVAAAARVRGWGVMSELARTGALLGEEVQLAGGGRGRARPELAAELLSRLSGGAW